MELGGKLSFLLRSVGGGSAGLRSVGIGQVEVESWVMCVLWDIFKEFVFSSY